MKKRLLFLLCLIIPIFCFAEDDFKLPDYILKDLDFQPSYTFWEEFCEYKDSFHDYDPVADQLLGRWVDTEVVSPGTYWFFPNSLFIYSVYIPISEEKTIKFLFSIWEIVDNEVQVTIHGYLFDIRENDKNVGSVYIKCNSYTVTLFDVTKIDPVGYSKRKFNYIPFPQELDNMITYKKEYEEKFHRYRILFRYDIFSQPKPPFDKRYSLFSVIPTLAEERLSAEDILNNEDILMRLFGDTSLVLR